MLRQIYFNTLIIKMQIEVLFVKKILILSILCLFVISCGNGKTNTLEKTETKEETTSMFQKKKLNL